LANEELQDICRRNFEKN